jgi:catechol 2,3-dioxygenase-like lactoylglutathione lyase family enzyme
LKIDHFVLTVRSLEKTCAFYNNVVGLNTITFVGTDGEVRKALQCGESKINLHQAGQEFEPKAKHTAPGSADFCLIVSEDIESLMSRLAGVDVKVEDGPVSRTGAVGPLMSIYVRDPDQNLVELSNQTA